MARLHVSWELRSVACVFQNESYVPASSAKLHKATHVYINSLRHARMYIYTCIYIYLYIYIYIGIHARRYRGRQRTINVQAVVTGSDSSSVVQKCPSRSKFLAF